MKRSIIILAALAASVLATPTEAGATGLLRALFHGHDDHHLSESEFLTYAMLMHGGLGGGGAPAMPAQFSGGGYSGGGDMTRLLELQMLMGSGAFGGGGGGGGGFHSGGSMRPFITGFILGRRSCTAFFPTTGATQSFGGGCSCNPFFSQ